MVKEDRIKVVRHLGGNSGHFRVNGLFLWLYRISDPLLIYARKLHLKNVFLK